SVTVGGQSPTETIGPFVVTETNGDHHHYLYVWDETAIGSMLGTTISYSDGGGNFTKGFLWGTIEDTDQSALSNFTGTAFNLAASSLNVTSTSSAGDLIVCGSIAS